MQSGGPWRDDHEPGRTVIAGVLLQIEARGATEVHPYGAWPDDAWNGCLRSIEARDPFKDQARHGASARRVSLNPIIREAGVLVNPRRHQAKSQNCRQDAHGVKLNPLRPREKSGPLCSDYPPCPMIR